MASDQWKRITSEAGEIDDPAEEGTFAELLERSFVAPVRYEPGQRIVARVLKVTPEWVFLDLGRKGEGILSAKELTDAAGTVPVKEGDSLASYFVSSDGSEMLFTTRVGGSSAGTAPLEEAWRNGIPVDGLVVKEVKGGFEVRLAGAARAFCPYSQMGLPRTRGAGEFPGKHAAFRITRYGERGRNIVVSSRVLLEEEEERKRRESMAILSEGMVVRGKVTALRDFGAFVDIGPIEGLLPVSEVGWERIHDIRDVLAVGQEIEVSITRLDWVKKKFTFSLKKTLADPWDSAEPRFPQGSRHTGTVVRLAAFGAFVSLGSGVDGLLHVSRLGGGKRVGSAGEVLRVGQEIEVRVDRIDAAQRRISLSMAGADEADAEGEESEEYRKYLDPSPPPPPVGALGEALRAKLAQKKPR